MADKGEKTQPPTPKRLEKARRDGNFPASREMVSAMQFLAFAAMVASWGPGWIAGMRQTMRWLLASAFTRAFDATVVVRLAMDMVWRVFVPLMTAGALVVAATLAVQLAVTNMGFSLKKVAPDFKRLS